MLVQLVGDNKAYMMNLCGFDEYIDIEENYCKECPQNTFSWDPQNTSSSCIRCSELDGKWDYNTITKYLGDTICYDVKNGNDSSGSGGSGSSTCSVFCGEGQEWIWPTIIGGVVTIVIAIVCIVTPAKASRPKKTRKSFREEAEGMLLVII